uniref:Uncharacterized protein n=1 Tax=Arundo donax TaxID=35708 RepID=A0A0A8Z6P8_ARUDO
MYLAYPRICIFKKIANPCIRIVSYPTRVSVSE